MGPSAISVFLLSLVFISHAVIPVPALPRQDCNFPAIFNFGDSNSDTGALSAAFLALPPPYGETFFRMPAGRFSDGRLIIDFIANSFRLPFLSAYLNSLGTEYSHGSNFATAGSPIQPVNPVTIPFGPFSPFFLLVQLSQFQEFIPRSQFIREQGGAQSNSVPMEDFFGKALYTIDIGQNDLDSGLYRGLTAAQVAALVPEILLQFSITVKGLYKLGARSFWIHNTGPLGCLPMILTRYPLAPRDLVGCAVPYNELAQVFNKELKVTVAKLREELPLAAITYVDIYSVKFSLFAEPARYGFESPLLTCCGHGGKYNFSVIAPCGLSVEVGGKNISVGSCGNPSVRVIWDGTHYTEAANKFVFDQISTGKFSDPPVPLKLACQKAV